MSQEGFSEQTMSVQANVVDTGVLRYSWTVKLPGVPRGEEGRCLRTPIPCHPLESHPSPTHPPFHPDCFCPTQLLLPCLIQLCNDLLGFLASTELSGVRTSSRQHTCLLCLALASLPQWDTGPSFRLVYMSHSNIHPHLSIIPILKEE